MLTKLMLAKLLSIAKCAHRVCFSQQKLPYRKLLQLIMGDDPKSVSRRMKYPYTHTAKIVQFPWKFYFKYNRAFRYYIISIPVCFPVFWYINTLANTPENKAKWDAIRRKDFGLDKE